MISTLIGKTVYKLEKLFKFGGTSFPGKLVLKIKKTLLWLLVLVEKVLQLN